MATLPVVSMWVALWVNSVLPRWSLRVTVIPPGRLDVPRQLVSFRAVPCMAQRPTWPAFVLTILCRLLALNLRLWQKWLAMVLVLFVTEMSLVPMVLLRLGRVS